ncbi:hypothetical protein FRC17_001205 [Serendipita sp. 399]|nr:hypothetical protein FRC17_001205 [Serendipita sp. 399]
MDSKSSITLTNPYFTTAIQAIFLQFHSGMLSRNLAKDRLRTLYWDTGGFESDEELEIQVQFWNKLLEAGIGTVLTPPPPPPSLLSRPTVGYEPEATRPLRQAPTSNLAFGLTTRNVDLQGPEHFAFTVDFVDRYTRYLDSSRRYITSHSGVPSLPSFIWDLVLQGKYVDLNLILPHALDNEEVLEVQTVDQWCRCWVVYSRAVTMAFPHRTSELYKYSTWISRLFNEIENALHPNVLQMDVVLRTQVDLRERPLRLDDGNLAIHHLFTSVFPSDESSLDFHLDSSPVTSKFPAIASK